MHPDGRHAQPGPVLQSGARSCPTVQAMKTRFALLALMTLSACQTAPLKPMNTVPHVDLPRFMGAWYVIASIPTFLEKDAYGAVETYALAADGTIDTTFTFRKGGFDGEEKRMTPRGFVRDDPSNALWGMQFVWPIKADYRIVWLADDYSQTIVAREKRDYLWIMARTPQIPEQDFEKHVAFAVSLGYDPSLIRKVPQRADTARSP
jgi:apolipoprotein D and lipocalin family protein